MKQLFTKKDKRTNLEKEIDDVLNVIVSMKAELDDSPSGNLDKRIDSLLDEMSKVDAGSEDYLNMAKSLDILYKAKASIKTKLEAYTEMVKNYKALCEERDKKKERKEAIKKVLIAGAIQIIGLVVVVKHEEVNVITSKAFSHIPWVRS